MSKNQKSKRQQLTELAEDKRIQEALINGYIWFQDDFERRMSRAATILRQAQRDVDDLEARFHAAPDKIVACEKRLRQIVGELNQKVRQPRVDQIAKLKARIAKLEAMSDE